MNAVINRPQVSAEEIERIRLVLIEEDVLEMLSGLHTCYEADEDHGGVADDEVTGGTVQRARDLEAAINWLKPGYIGDAFPQEWVLAELTKLRAENVAMKAALEELDASLDRQLYDDEHVRRMRNNDMDIAPDCEHHVVIRHELWSKISKALQPTT